MPKATEKTKQAPRPVSVEKERQAQGLDPYATDEARGPVKVPLNGDIRQPVAPSRFPAPEVEVEALHRGVEDRGFTFGSGARWQTTRARSNELAGSIKITKEL
jgi:hypothetical protein